MQIFYQIIFSPDIFKSALYNAFCIIFNSMPNSIIIIYYLFLYNNFIKNICNAYLTCLSPFVDIIHQQRYSKKSESKRRMQLRQTFVIIFMYMHISYTRLCNNIRLPSIFLYLYTKIVTLTSIKLQNSRQAEQMPVIQPKRSGSVNIHSFK